MIKKYLPILLLSYLTACTTVDEPLRPVDEEKASQLNAQLGLGYMQQGKYKLAQKKLNKAIAYNPDNAAAHHYMAEVYRRLDQAEKAEKHYQEALSIAPKDSTLRNNYGVFLCDLGKYDKAYKWFEEIIQDPFYTSKAQAYENIGLCRLREGRLKLAEVAFIEALQVNPRLPKSLINLSQLYYDQGNVHNSYKSFKQYLKVAKHTPESLWLGVLLERARGNIKIARNYAIKLKGKYPDSDQAKWLYKLEQQGKL